MPDPADGDLRLVPHPRGPWLLYTEGRCFLVPPELGRSLARVAGEAAPPRGVADPTSDSARRLLAVIRMAARAAPRTSRRHAVWPRLPLVPAGWVDAAARRIAPLASWPLLAGQAVVGATGYALGFHRLLAGSFALDLPGRSGLAGLAGLAPALCVFLGLVLWHELGHAAALRREGYPAGGVGMGLLLVLPVFYCDVSALAGLPRAGRLRVDVAGIAFQLGLGGVLFLAGTLLNLPALRWAGVSGLLVLGWSALPFLRTDGYWFVADLLGVASLDEALEPPDPPAGAPGHAAPPRPSPRRRLLAATLVIYRLVYTAFLGGLAVLLPWRLAARLHLARLAAGLTEAVPSNLRPPPVAVEAALTALILALGLWLAIRLARRIRRLLRATARDLRTALARRAAPSIDSIDPGRDALPL